MTRTPTIRKADLDRVLKAIKDAGQEVGSIVVRPGGVVEITPALTTGGSAAQRDELAQWRERRNARRAP